MSQQTPSIGQEDLRDIFLALSYLVPSMRVNVSAVTSV